MAELGATTVRRLDDVRRRCEERANALRVVQVGIMTERNLFLRKVRDIEDYGRARNWGLPASPGSVGLGGSKTVDGAELLRAVYDVLYDNRSAPNSPSSHHAPGQ